MELIGPTSRTNTRPHSTCRVTKQSIRTFPGGDGREPNYALRAWQRLAANLKLEAVLVNGSFHGHIAPGGIGGSTIQDKATPGRTAMWHWAERPLNDLQRIKLENHLLHMRHIFSRHCRLAGITSKSPFSRAVMATPRVWTSRPPVVTKWHSEAEADCVASKFQSAFSNGFPPKFSHGCGGSQAWIFCANMPGPASRSIFALAEVLKWSPASETKASRPKISRGCA